MELRRNMTGAFSQGSVTFMNLLVFCLEGLRVVPLLTITLAVILEWPRVESIVPSSVKNKPTFNGYRKTWVPCRESKVTIEREHEYNIFR